MDIVSVALRHHTVWSPNAVYIRRKRRFILRKLYDEIWTQSIAKLDKMNKSQKQRYHHSLTSSK